MGLASMWEDISERAGDLNSEAESLKVELAVLPLADDFWIKRLQALAFGIGSASDELRRTLASYEELLTDPSLDLAREVLRLKEQLDGQRTLHEAEISALRADHARLMREQISRYERVRKISRSLGVPDAQLR